MTHTTTACPIYLFTYLTNHPSALGCSAICTVSKTSGVGASVSRASSVGVVVV